MEYIAALLVYLPTFFLVFVRVSGVLFFSPLFGAPLVPRRVKIGLGICVAFLLFPIAGKAPLAGSSALSLRYLAALVREAALGITLGFSASVLFSAFRFAGDLVGRQMGLAFGEVADPLSEGSSSAVTQFASALGMLLLLAINGHHWIIRAIGGSYSVVQSGGEWDLTHAMRQLVLTFSGAFNFGIGLIAPALMILLLVTVAIGVVGRAVPQFNIMLFAFPVRIAAGFIVLTLSMPFFIQAGRSLLEGLPGALLSLLRAP